MAFFGGSLIGALKQTKNGEARAGCNSQAVVTPGCAEQSSLLSIHAARRSRGPILPRVTRQPLPGPPVQNAKQDAAAYFDSKFGYGQTKWMVTMYSKYTAHMSSNGSHLLTAWVLVYWTYKVSKFWYGHTKWMYSKSSAHISSNWSHFLTARVLVYWTYKVNKFGYWHTQWMVTM